MRAAAVTSTITIGGSPVSATITTAGDTVRLSFTGSWGERLGLGISSNTFGCCPALKLLAADGTQVGPSRALSSGNGDWNLPTLPGDGTYTIVFTPSRRAQARRFSHCRTTL